MDWSFQRSCEAAAAAWEVPALVVAVAADGRTDTYAVGCDPDTRFRIASITKPCTAMLALELLDLDATSGIWPSEVRVRHLLSHTSGYGERAEPEATGDGDDALATAVAQLGSVRRFVGVEQVWSYCNAGYWIAGRLSAERAGSTFEEALARYVLDPAGMEAAAFDEPEIDGTGPTAPSESFPRARRPSGGLVGNVADVVALGRWLLASPAWPQMRVAHGKPPGGVYGLGLAGERVAGVEVWGHRGSWGGYQSSLLVLPDRDAVFAGVTNSSRGTHALREIEDMFFDRLLGAQRRVPEEHELPADVLRGFEGAYANSMGRYDVRVEGRGLAVTLPDGEFAARAIGSVKFEFTDREHERERFDFPLDSFGRFESRLAERLE